MTRTGVGCHRLNRVGALECRVFTAECGQCMLPTPVTVQGEARGGSHACLVTSFPKPSKLHSTHTRAYLGSLVGIQEVGTCTEYSTTMMAVQS